MANTIKQKRGTTDPGASDLVVGELAINTTDGGVFTKTDGGTVVEVGGAGGASEINDLSDGVSNSSGQTLGLGTDALANDDGTSNNNTAVGYQALYSNTTGYYNTANGYQAFFSNTTGNNNTAVGYQALYSNTTGTSNIVIGTSAGRSVTTSNRNVFVGFFAGYTVSTGTENVAVGARALQNGNATACVAVGPYALQTSSGTGNTALGYYAGQTISTGTNNTCLGFGAAASSGTVSNEITLGNSSVTTLRCNTQTISSLSDARDKTDVEDLPAGLSFIDSLRPVKFKWETRDGNSKDGTHEAGFIAQELQSAQRDADADYLGLVMDENPDRLEASYGKLIPMLVKAIQELKSEMEQLKANV